MKILNKKTFLVLILTTAFLFNFSFSVLFAEEKKVEATTSDGQDKTIECKLPCGLPLENIDMETKDPMFQYYVQPKGSIFGECVFATGDGKIKDYSSYNAKKGAYIEIDHGDGLVTSYQWLGESAIEVDYGFDLKEGTDIKKGQKIGTTGVNTFRYYLYVDGKNTVPPDYWAFYEKDTIILPISKVGENIREGCRREAEKNCSGVEVCFIPEDPVEDEITEEPEEISEDWVCGYRDKCLEDCKISYSYEDRCDEDQVLEDLGWMCCCCPPVETTDNGTNGTGTPISGPSITNGTDISQDDLWKDFLSGAEDWLPMLLEELFGHKMGEDEFIEEPVDPFEDLFPTPEPAEIPTFENKLYCLVETSDSITLGYEYSQGINVTLFLDNNQVGIYGSKDGAGMETISGLEPDTSYTFHLRNGRQTSSPLMDSVSCMTKQEKTETQKGCEVDVREAREYAQGKVCTSEFREMICDDLLVYGARDGCEISFLEERGWESLDTTIDDDHEKYDPDEEDEKNKEELKQLRKDIDRLTELVTELVRRVAGETTTTPSAPTTPTGIPAVCQNVTFNRNLTVGDRGMDVRCLQSILNLSPRFQIAASGPGSPGNETDYFGNLTKTAVIKFQEAVAPQVLHPIGLTSGTGYVGPSTRNVLNTLLARR